MSFPEGCLGPEKPIQLMKWMHSISESENLKPFSDTQSWMMLTYSCKSLSTLFNDLLHTNRAKSWTNKEQSVPFKPALTMSVILMLNRAGDRTSLWIPHPLSCSSDRVEPTLTLKECSGRKPCIHMGRWPLKQRSQRSASMLCFHTTSSAFSRSRK